MHFLYRTTDKMMVDCQKYKNVMIFKITDDQITDISLKQQHIDMTALAMHRCIYIFKHCAAIN